MREGIGTFLSFETSMIGRSKRFLLFSTSFSLESQLMLIQTHCIGICVSIRGLMPSLSIRPLMGIRRLISLGKPFGKLRLLGESPSLCGLQLGERFSPVIILCGVDIAWLGGVVMCRVNGESVNHLLIHCRLASDLWYIVLRSFGVIWVFPDNVADLLYGWYNCFGKQNSLVWNLAPLCLMWIVWRERNSRIFEDKEHSTTKLTELFFGTLFDWARVWGFTSALSVADFVVSLSFSL